MATAVVSRKKANHITDEIDGLFEIFLLVIPLVVKKIRAPYGPQQYLYPTPGRVHLESFKIQAHLFRDQIRHKQVPAHTKNIYHLNLRQLALPIM